jgi:hypothetical protein
VAPLSLPADQPITARLAGAGSLRRELEAVLAAAPPDARADTYRHLLMDENVAGKASANARMWMWKRLKLRYALDAPESAEFQAFRWAANAAATPTERGLVAALMMARTDRLFRELTTELIAPVGDSRGTRITSAEVRTSVRRLAESKGLKWSDESVTSIANHFLSSVKDFGIVEGSRERRMVGIRITPVVATFAAQLGRAEGLTDRQVLDGSWFRMLGASTNEAAAGLREAAKAGLIDFRMQADVVELRLPERRAAGTA